MRLLRLAFVLVLCVVVLLAPTSRVRACGPSYISPIFVFDESPDLPLREFTEGKIGIVRPGFGRKTLVIAYRYLNGGSFTADEQKALEDALRARSPEDNIAEAIKAWIEARKQFGPKEKKLPEIYAERQYGGYDFFPNCTRNAFEVATETLKDRVSSHGADDANVRTWLLGQDTVFQNCSAGGAIPRELGAESPQWLRHDRDYQIAAALFYSLRFEEALAGFQRIAADGVSPWQETANYLVARTLVRHASLSENEEKKRALYDQAEDHLRVLMSAGGKFRNASGRLLGLVKYRIHPEERVGELARILESHGNENLRQDLIDYTWLLDKFEGKMSEEARKQAAKDQPPENPSSYFNNEDMKERYDAIQRGELVSVTFQPKSQSGEMDYRSWTTLDLKPDLAEADVVRSFEVQLARKLTPEETQEIMERYQGALSHRQYLVNPNRKWEQGRHSWEGCDYDCLKPSLNAFPSFLRADDLSDWIFTFQSSDPGSYAHAVSKWRQTKSPAWFVAALSKSTKTSPGVIRLLNEAEKMSRDAPMFATGAYHLVRLQMEFGKPEQARKLLDEIITWQEGILPISTQNQFLEQRMKLAESLDEFLKFALRTPVAFYHDGALGSVKDLLEVRKEYWSEEYSGKTKEEYDRDIEEEYKRLLLWEDRGAFDDAVIDVLNWHFPLEELVRASRSKSLPEHLRRQVALAAWTRAVLLRKEDVAVQMTPEVIKTAPEFATLMKSYLDAQTSPERSNAELYILLKSPGLSPMTDIDLSDYYARSEELEYYFESAWWCAPSETEYDDNGKEVPKIVSKPGFLTPNQLKTAREERSALIAIGDAKRYLGKRAIEWAKASPEDPRIPEALFIAVKANERYKYGCDGWSFDEQTMEDAEKILRERYPRSPWTAKLDERGY